tara:strand:- start:1959 stop:2528 length:570 start_codon:yes stop_codon:yes gene_type:complete
MLKNKKIMSNLFNGFSIDKYKIKNPPKDNSLTTLKEIKDLQNLPKNPKFVQGNDDIAESFKKVTDKYKLEFPKKLVDDLINQSKHPVLQLKNFFNRKRPKDLAGNFGLQVDHVEMPSMKTPSYPSGHSVQGVLIAKVLGKIFPKYKKEFSKVGKNISDSRRIGRAHYKSDSKLGEEIGNDMFNYVKDKI